ncbi:MAG: hydrogenase expression/formation protein HypE [Rhodocyclaceae bacterium]
MNRRPTDDFPPLDVRHGRIDLGHGAGGRATAQLVARLFAPAFDNAFLARGDDGAVLPSPLPGERLVISTDAHVVTPLFFPGGDIGCLSVHGTINDLAVMGARPLYLSAAFVLEEGLALADLARVVASMAEAARAAGVAVVTGDTKVVERGKGDGVFIVTTGVGAAPAGRQLGGTQVRSGDAILLSGSIGDHGMAIMACREGLAFETEIRSDTAALHGLAADVMAAAPGLHAMRDPTRGGLAAALNEIAAQAGVGMMLDETVIPVQPAVRAVCELLGLDPLHIANEGKLLAICAERDADAALAAMRAHPLGRAAARIGTVVEDEACFVQLRTGLGGCRLVDWLSADPLPRIC